MVNNLLCMTYLKVYLNPQVTKPQVNHGTLDICPLEVNDEYRH
jgi:hypothetical protein